MWQPGNTAPKDGTHVLLYCEVEKVIVSSRWWAQPDTPNGGAWYGTDPMDRLNWIQWPDYWMPMPPAPPPEKPRLDVADAAAESVD